MIPRVHSLDEARDFFLAHASGEVLCIDAERGRTQIVSSYLDAQQFYAGE